MIKIENIFLKHHQQTIFEDFSLKVASSDKVLITGNSGIGKSSLLSLILGFTKADSGRISIDNLQLSSTNIRKIRKKIAYLPQNLNALGIGTVSSLFERIFNLKSNKHIPSSSDLIKKELNMLDLSIETYDKQLESLSGGEKQRIGLVLTKMLNRKIILLDEPTSALDNSAKIRAMEYINNQIEATILVVSHDASIEKYFNRKVELCSTQKT